MATTQYEGGGKRYLSIVQGEIKQKAEEGAEGAKLRKYELRDGTKGEKWEYSFDDVSGIVVRASIEDGKFGKSLELEFDDGDVLSVGVKTRYFSSLARKLPNVNFDEPLKVSPYDFESNGKKNTGITLYQNDKLEDFFYDSVSKKSLHKMPESTEEDKSDWAFYFAKVDKFLIKYLETNVFPNIKPATTSTPVSSSPDEESLDDILNA